MHLQKHEGGTSAWIALMVEKSPFAEFMFGGVINGVVFYHIIIFE